MDTEDITITLTRDQFDALRRFVFRAQRTYASEAETWRKLKSDPDMHFAEHNEKVNREEHDATVLMEQLLTEAYVKAVAPELV